MARELGLGGTERQLAEIALSLDRDQFEPHVGCFTSGGFRAGELRQAGVPILELGVRSLISSYHLSLALPVYLAEHDIALVHAFDVPLDLFAVPVARWYRTPVVLASTLVWLVLGYAFYCWVYAAAGSLAERQDQVQSLAFPLSLPIIFGYIMALTAAGSASPSSFFKVLAYLPPTAPFAMPVLVGLGKVTWWEFLASAVISIVCTVGVARLATGIYRRAILRTGGRVKLRDVLTRAAG